MTAATQTERLSAEAWIADARRRFKPGLRSHCAICKRYRALAQAHHIIPLALQYARGYEEQDARFMWLCPTHHAAIHVLFASGASFTEKTMGRAAVTLINELVSNMDELGALLDLHGMAAGSKQ